MEEIIKLEEELKTLKIKYKEMTEEGYERSAKIEILKAMEDTASNLYSLLNNETQDVHRIISDIECTRFHHERLLIDKDFFFNNLLIGLNREDKKFNKLNLAFNEYGYQGRGARGEDSYGTNYYDYTIVGTNHFISQLEEKDKMNNRLLWSILNGEIKNKNDIIIQSEGYTLPHINCEQRKLDFGYGSDGCYYKGHNQPEIDFVIDAITYCAKTYGIDFNETVFSKQLQKS